MARISLKTTVITVLIVSSVEFSKCIDDNKCVQQNPCMCKFEDGQLIDIKKISNGETNVRQGNLTYYFFGCSNGVINKTLKCGSLCLYNQTSDPKHNITTLTTLGNADELKFLISESDPHTYDLSYKNGTSKVELVCAPNLSETKLILSPNSTSSQNRLILLSKDVCKIKPGHEGGLSTGSTLLILFLIGMLCYFIGGALVLYFLRGARGTEMIPNVDFWKDLPNLVKDGLIFLLNGCRPTAVATAETYDRI